MKPNKMVIFSFMLFLISLLGGFLYPVISDVVLGDTKDAINDMLSPYLKPMPPKGYIPLMLLLITVIFQAYQLSLDKETLEEQMTKLEEDKEELTKRLANYIDKGVTKPHVHFVSNRKEDKLMFLQSRMEAFVKKEPYVKGIQLYEFSFSTSKINVKRVVEYIDDVSSWDSVTLNFHSIIFHEFQKCIQKGEEKKFVKKCEDEINSLKIEDINEHHIFQFVLMNVAIRILSDKNEKVNVRLNHTIIREMYRKNKRIGIIEAIVYTTFTNSQYFYVFKKKFGDLEKVGRYYFALPYTVDNEPHMMLFTFDKGIQEVSQISHIDSVLSDKVEYFLNTIEK